MFKPDSASLTRSFSANPFAKLVMTPYVLDSIINKGVPNAGKTPSIMAKNIKTFKTMTPFYEDNGDNTKPKPAPGTVKKQVLPTKKNQMNDFDMDDELEEGDQGAPPDFSQNEPLVNGAEKEAKMSDANQAIMGLDEEDMTREREIITLAEAIKSQREILKRDVAKDVENTVDLGYYALSNDAFQAVLPVIEVNHF
jgi:hypothetical protein